MQRKQGGKIQEVLIQVQRQREMDEVSGAEGQREADRDRNKPD